MGEGTSAPAKGRVTLRRGLCGDMPSKSPSTATWYGSRQAGPRTAIRPPGDSGWEASTERRRRLRPRVTVPGSPVAGPAASGGTWSRAVRSSHGDNVVYAIRGHLVRGTHTASGHLKCDWGDRATEIFVAFACNLFLFELSSLVCPIVLRQRVFRWLALHDRPLWGLAR